MSAAEVARALDLLGAMRIAAGQPFRGSCIKATATQIRELTPAEMSMVGLTSGVTS